MPSRFVVVLVSVLAVSVSIGIGVIIGYFSHPSANSNVQAPIEDESIQQKLMNSINKENIQTHLKFLTKKPHIAGRSNDEVELVTYIENEWKANGLDNVVSYPYNVLLSYPKQGDSNYVAIVAADGTESDISQRKELVIDPEQNDPDVVDPFNAYSAAGEPEGDIVYVNYGTIDDFIYLNRTMLIDFHNKICIARYGSIFRGDKAKHAEQYGCAGLILYSDPANYCVPGEGVYPDSWYLPPTGVQRGNLKLARGDPRTIDYPSIPTAWFKNVSETSLPKIPVTPIGYIDAVKYLSKMGGPAVPAGWSGGLNITYRIGPGFSGTYASSKMKMSVKTENEEKEIKNVMGFIRGSVEPDRYVLFGNHRDAWVFGATDPSSGTAVLMEMVRSYSVMLKQGWRPRRTLVFCSWGAEEYGLIGSTEWVEEFQKQLLFRAVAYINVDVSVKSSYVFSCRGVYSLSNLMFDVAKSVPNPDTAEVSKGRTTVYDTWLLRSPFNSSDPSSLPFFGTLGSGSDYTMFLQSVGVPAIDMTYDYDRGLGISSYPLYHSVYETFDMVTTYVDPEFTYHLAMARIWAEAGRRLSDSVILPIDCRLYGVYLDRSYDSLMTIYGKSMRGNGIDTDKLKEVIDLFAVAANEIHDKENTLDLSNDFLVRGYNDQLMQLERAFLDQNPLPGRPVYRHYITAPSQHNNYGNSGFPGLVDSMFDIDADPDQVGRWEEVKRQYSILIFHILSAASTLRTPVPM
uniref:putative N-acetylated-alpha-linked acidic dipeptidase n=1 Tax=Ciona intestinalis TaxID=7719 RepID=UPI000180D41C|nr:putative N-acetylated-alpha-linked acidic dipeptidase [Ciona intestinalis]|eukprot:XP_009859433.1 putative N-acetylated-alpha-linked acidic dipeptidase [Ciona intestinalis]